MNEIFLDFDKLYQNYFNEANPNHDWKTGSVYIRVSSDEQIEYSPTSQLKLLLKYALEHKIFIEKKYIFHDDGITGTQVSKRNGFKAMIAEAQKPEKTFDILLVYDFSRFARNKDESVTYKALLRKKCNIDVVSITQPLTNSKESVLLESVYEGFDEYYVIKLSEEVKRGKREKAERGEHNGNPPFGYDYDRNTKRLIINEEKAKIVKLIYDTFISTQNLRHIAFTLNQLNVKPMRGNEWGTKTLKLILTNKSYIGKVKYLNNYYDGIHEPIIDVEKFDKVQKIWEYRDEHFKKCKVQVQHNHWLRGILKCGFCGKGMVYFQRKNRKEAIFQCSGYSNGKCSSHYVKVGLVEKSILNLIKKDYTEKININISNQQTFLDEEIKIILSSLKKIDDKFERIKIAYQNGIDSLEEYKLNKQKILSEKNQLEKKLSELKYQSKLDYKKEKVYTKCEVAYKILSDKNTDNQIKFDISHELFEKIIYNKESDTLIITYK